MKIYTRRGDRGETDLIGGKRVLKHDLRVDAYGSVDEASAQIGFSRSIIKNKEINNILFEVQKKLITLMGELASSKELNSSKNKILKKDIEELEGLIDYYSQNIAPLTSFIIPGNDPESASLHVARTVVRRAERRVVELKQVEENMEVDEIIAYLNRLSDLLFTLAVIIEQKYSVK